MDLDSIARGANDADLAPLEGAARRTAFFEESAVYNGFAPAGIKRIIPACAHQPISLPKNTREFPETVARAIETMTRAGTEGPFVLVLGTEVWGGLMQSGSGGYPPQRIIRNMIDGEPRRSPAIEGGLLVLAAGGKFELTVNQDFSVNYASHDRDKVELYLTETFTFRVLESKASVRLNPV